MMRTLSLIALLLFSSLSFAQVAHDGEANVTGQSGSPTVNPTLTGKTTAGANRLGVLGCSVNALAEVTGATWNGEAMASVTTATASNGQSCLIYRIANPATASSNVVLTTSGAGTRYICTASSYNGAHQTTQDGDTSTATGTTEGTATVDVTSASGEMVVDQLYLLDGGTAPTVGAGQTQNGNTDNGIYHGSSSREAGAATTTMSWGLTGATNWATCAFSIRAVAASSGLLLRRRRN